MTASAKEWERRLHKTSAGALYVHIPFCQAKCAYCDFASWATQDTDPCIKTYVASLIGQLHQLSSWGLLEGCTTAYVGGGTPSLLGAKLLGELVLVLREVAPQLQELSFEANPESLSDEVLAAATAAGATRVSIGIQSLQDDELAALGRIHTAARAQERLQAAVATGLATSCDLMCAIPLQTAATWEQTLHTVVELGVSHVSVYPLAIEEHTALWAQTKGEAAWNDPDIQAARMLSAQELLTTAGFSRYEVASYARPGYDCVHNQAYWTGISYIGLGTQAASMLTREGYEALRAHLPALPEAPCDARRIRLVMTAGRHAFAQNPRLQDQAFEVEFLNQREAAAEDLMLGARRTQGLDQGLIAHASTVYGEGCVQDTLTQCMQEGLLYQTPAGLWAPTQTGWLLGNELFGHLYDLAYDEE